MKTDIAKIIFNCQGFVEPKGTISWAIIIDKIMLSKYCLSVYVSYVSIVIGS